MANRNTKSKTDLKKLDAMTDEDIQRTIDNDPDSIPDMSEPVEGIRRVRGKQLSPTKMPVSLRLSPEVIEHFKKSGRGWQTRIDEELKKIVREG